MSLSICEIYSSIQGESSYAGKPCVFVRLSGCPFNCSYCDTEYAMKMGQMWSVSSIVHKVCEYGVPLVEVTGGEPLAQKESVPLLRKLLDNNFKVLLETAGLISVHEVPLEVVKIMDIKTPSSGVMDKMCWENFEYLSAKDEVKFVLQDEHDYKWAVKVMAKYQLGERCSVLLAPVMGILPLETLADWILRDKLSVRLQMQLHKYIWPSKKYFQK